MVDVTKLRTMANALRMLSVDGVEAAKSGHPGLPMGAADLVATLFSGHIRVDAANPEWPNRDRFVLSAGHGSMLLYSLYHLLGFADWPIDELKKFRQLHSKTPGHPEYEHQHGIEMTTGPLGQGISTSVGMALAERLMNAQFGDIVDHRTFVLASDGDLMEGVSHEAISLAGHLKLDRLTVLYDDNQISIDGPLTLSESGDVVKRFEAAGWRAERIDGHDIAAIDAALGRAAASDRPTLIAARTVIGFGSPNKAGTHGVHGSPLGSAEAAATREKLGWPYGPFEIPHAIRADWHAAAKIGADAQAEWQARFDALDAGVRDEFLRRRARELPAGFAATMTELRENSWRKSRSTRRENRRRRC